MIRYAEYSPSGFDGRGAFSHNIGDDSTPGEDWMVVIGRNRDSGILDRHNWEEACRILPEGDDVQIHRFGHWACGWLEVLLVRPGTDAAATGEKIGARLEDYPILNEDRYSEMEWDETCKAWEGASLRERIRLCADAGVSILAARHDWIPDSDRIRESLRPD